MAEGGDAAGRRYNTQTLRLGEPLRACIAADERRAFQMFRAQGLQQQIGADVAAPENRHF